MNRYDIDRTILSSLNERAQMLEQKLSSSVVAYYGSIHPGFLKQYRDTIEAVAANSAYPERICLLLKTMGGSAEAAESMALILRNHFSEVSFIVPDAAMSAGTILCMSGDRIYMDYSSALGPIDPQVVSPDRSGYVAAMGYLDKVDEIVAKTELSQAEIIFLRSIDLGRLALYEQARSFSIDLLKEWLVQYKFKNWSHHRSTNIGNLVSVEEKDRRAEQIAIALADHKRWRSHARALNMTKLRKLGLEIDDMCDDPEMHDLVRSYNDPLSMYVERMNLPLFIHNHNLAR